jgi:hypothetical protein
MDHDEAKLLLSEYLEGTLDESLQAHVRAHVDACAECRAWIESYQLVEKAMSKDSETHPSSDDLAAFTVEPESLAAPTLASIARHISRCESCREIVEATRDAVQSAPETTTSAVASRRGTMWTALAAAIAVVALGCAAYLGLGRVPALSRDNHELRQRLERVSDWSGAVGYLMLTDSTRSSSPPPSLEPRQNQPWVTLAVGLELPGDVAPAVGVRFRIFRLEGEPVWNENMPAGEVRRLLQAHEVLLLQVPSSSLPPGAYELRVALATAPQSRLLTSRFEIRAPTTAGEDQRQSPSATNAPQ